MCETVDSPRACAVRYVAHRVLGHETAVHAGGATAFSAYVRIFCAPRATQGSYSRMQTGVKGEGTTLLLPIPLLLIA